MPPAIFCDSSTESLAGRAEHIAIGCFSLAEIGAEHAPELWRRGGFPLAYLARSERDSLDWRKQFIQTLLELDPPQCGVRVPAIALRRFWTMVAHYHGQTWNAAEPARALGVNESTTRRYLDLLTDALMIRQRTRGWPTCASGSPLAQGLRARQWAAGVECKRADAPRLTPSMRIALEDLGLERIAVIYPGEKRYPIADQVEVVPLNELATVRGIFGGEAGERG